MEKQLSFEDISYFRALVEAEIPKEKLPGNNQSDGWWSWGTSFFVADDQPNDEFQLHDNALNEIAASFGVDGRKEPSFPPEVSILYLIE